MQSYLHIDLLREMNLLLLRWLFYKLIFSSTFAHQMSGLTCSSGFSNKNQIGGAFIVSHLLLFIPPWLRVGWDKGITGSTRTPPTTTTTHTLPMVVVMWSPLLIGLLVTVREEVMLGCTSTQQCVTLSVQRRTFMMAEHFLFIAR